jgi:hypothetical protein
VAAVPWTISTMPKPDSFKICRNAAKGAANRNVPDDLADATTLVWNLGVNCRGGRVRAARSQRPSLTPTETLTVHCGKVGFGAGFSPYQTALVACITLPQQVTSLIITADEKFGSHLAGCQEQ